MYKLIANAVRTKGSQESLLQNMFIMPEGVAGPWIY